MEARGHLAKDDRSHFRFADIEEHPPFVYAVYAVSLPQLHTSEPVLFTLFTLLAYLLLGTSIEAIEATRFTL